MNLSRMLFHPSEIPWAIRVYPRGNEIQDPENCDVQQCVLLHIGNVCDVNQYVCVVYMLDLPVVTGEGNSVANKSEWYACTTGQRDTHTLCII